MMLNIINTVHHNLHSQFNKISFVTMSKSLENTTIKTLFLTLPYIKTVSISGKQKPSLSIFQSNDMELWCWQDSTVCTRLSNPGAGQNATVLSQDQQKMQLPFVTSTGGVTFLMNAVYNFLKLGTAEDTINLLPFLKGQTIMNQSWGPAFEHVFLKFPLFLKYKLSWLYMHRL